MIQAQPTVETLLLVESGNNATGTTKTNVQDDASDSAAYLQCDGITHPLPPLIIENKSTATAQRIALVKLFQNLIVRRCLMPIDAFSAYRLVAIFLMTLTVAYTLYRCQVMKKYNRNY
jgi:hypothetical protein